MPINVSEGLQALRGRVAGLFMAHHAATRYVWADEAPILIKPTASAAQTHYETLTEENYESTLQKVYRHFNRRPGEVSLELFIYVSHGPISRINAPCHVSAIQTAAPGALRTQAGFYRATAGRMAAAATQIATAQQEEGAVTMGPLQTMYAQQSMARFIRDPANPGPPVSIPENTTTRQFAVMDQMVRDDRQAQDIGYATIHILFGDIELPVKVRRDTFRRALNLPANWRYTGDAEEPAENMEDIDHM